MFPAGGPDLPALQFVSVDGCEECEDDSPSYFNQQEADKVVKQVSNGCVCVCVRGCVWWSVCIGVSVCVLGFM